MNTDFLLTKFDFDKKPPLLRVCDTLITPLRLLVGGQRVECIRLGSSDRFLFKGPHEEKRNALWQVAKKITALACLLISWPLAVVGLLGKHFCCADQELFTRWASIKKAPGNRLNGDRYLPRALSDTHILFWDLGGTSIAKSRQLAYSAHLQAASYLKKEPQLTRFQGGNSFSATWNIQKQVERAAKNPALQGKEDKKQLDLILESLRELLEWCDKMLIFQSMGELRFLIEKKSRELLVADLSQRCRSLQEGEYFLLPVSLPNHALIAEIKCQSHGKMPLAQTFSLRFFNAGDGCRFHALDFKGAYPLAFENIPYQVLTDEKFLQEWLGRTNSLKEHRHKDAVLFFYQFLNRQLTPYKTVPQPQVVSERKKFQESGTCASTSIYSAIKGNVERSFHRKFRFAVKLEDLKHLIKQNERGLKVPVGAFCLAIVARFELRKRIFKYAKSMAETEAQIISRYQVPSNLLY